VLPSGGRRHHHRGEANETAQSSDLRVQQFVATVRGALIDLSWRAPEYDLAWRQLVGFELFRDDTSTRPPSRRTWRTMSSGVVQAPGLEILPHSEYGVQPIWRMYAPAPPYVIEFGPPRLTKDLAGPSIVVPTEERIHALASLQRQGLITSEEMEMAVERLLGSRVPEPEEPELEDAPTTPVAALPKTPAGSTGPAIRWRVLIGYLAAAVVLVLALVVGGPYVGRLLFSRPSAVVITPSPSPTQPSPSPGPTVAPLNLRPILIKLADVRAGYVAGQYVSTPLCEACVPAVSSLTVVLEHAPLHRRILSAATQAPTPADASSVLKALMNARNPGRWTTGKSLGNESYTLAEVVGNRTYLRVIWRTGSITNEIALISNKGSGLTMQNALELAQIQQARAVKARP
jgi:hypothetical protein